ncbi:hypothetical protein LJC11_01060 [Bacteroidales bacterium OttesenSCG-928-I21]|nr:hypothetical protein [Bacteroidales bacterium OttesenSCG-928-I21]
MNKTIRKIKINYFLDINRFKTLFIFVFGIFFLFKFCPIGNKKQFGVISYIELLHNKEKRILVIRLTNNEEIIITDKFINYWDKIKDSTNLKKEIIFSDPKYKEYSTYCDPANLKISGIDIYKSVEYKYLWAFCLLLIIFVIVFEVSEYKDYRNLLKEATQNDADIGIS